MLSNEYAKEPPPPDLPNPSLFSYMKAGEQPMVGFWFYISNMFHQLQLPSAFTDHFPVPPARFGDLDTQTKRDVLAVLKVEKLNDGDLIRSS